MYWCKQMSGKTILSVASPTTQSVEAVKSLIAYHHHGQEPQEMPPFYRLSADAVLVLSSKKDAYYVTTPRDCSCPAKTYQPGSWCKHQRRFFPQEEARAYQARQRELRAHRNDQPAMPEPAEGPRRLVVPPDHVSFKPFLEDGKRIDGYVAEVA